MSGVASRADHGSALREAERSVASTSADSLPAPGYALVAAAVGSWAAAVGGLAVWRHEQFLSHRYDLGNMVQAVWSTTQGRPLEMTDGVDGEQISRLAAHVDPILVLLAPFWWLHGSPTTLLVLQALALAAGVYPVVRLALTYTESRLAGGLLGAWYLVFPWMVWGAFDEFHPVTLAIPLLLYAIWFLDRHRLVPFAVLAALALATGELIGLTVAAVGVWYVLQHRRVVHGTLIAVAGAAWSAVCIAIVVPAFNDGEASRYYGRFESVGGSPTGLLETLVTDPANIVGQLTTAGDLEYLLLLLLPTAFIALLRPLVLLIAAPQLFVNLVSDYSAMALPWYHYVSALVPALVVATVMGMRRFPLSLRPVVALAPLLLSAVVLTAAAPVPGAEAFLFDEPQTAERRAAMRDALELVPAGAPVTATNRLGAHLSDRKTIHLFPQDGGAEWAVLDLRDPTGNGNVVERLGGFPRLLARFEATGEWRLVFDRESVRVYRRGNSSGAAR